MDRPIIHVKELSPEYTASEYRQTDKWVHALSRGWISRDIFELGSPTSERQEVAESLKRLHDRGYLTNVDVQRTIELFGGWPRNALRD